MKRTRGFTLIELLTVISIIGLISSVVLANIQNSRGKAKKAAAAQFHAHTQHVLGAQTVGAWEFDEGTYDGEPGTVAIDSSGSGMNGTIVGAVYDDNTYNGSGFSLYFDGVNDTITGTGINNSGTNSNVTIAAWVYPTSVVTPKTLFTSGSSLSACDSFGVTLNTTGKLQTESLVKSAASTISLELNTWQQMTMVYSSDGSVKTYINGSPSGSISSGAGTKPCAGSEWNIGRRVSTGSQYFAGNIDSLRVYNDVLTSEEVQQLYAQERQKMFAQVNNNDIQN